MIQCQSALAVLPARGESKQLPGTNPERLRGRPLGCIRRPDGCCPAYAHGECGVAHA